MKNTLVIWIPVNTMAFARARAHSTIACANPGGLVTIVKLMWMNVMEVCLLFLAQ